MKSCLPWKRKKLNKCFYPNCEYKIIYNSSKNNCSFCKYHKCSIIDCNFGRIKGYTYCNFHKCKNPNCYSLATNCNLCNKCFNLSMGMRKLIFNHPQNIN